MALEQEVKLALPDAAAYQRVCDGLSGFEGENEQSNTYWDREDRVLTRAGVLLRLRFEGGGATLTVKKGASVEGDGTFRVEEDEAPVDVELARAIAAGEREFASLESPVLDRLVGHFGDLAPWTKWGAMQNVRRCYRTASGLLLEVDRTVFPSGAVEWEVEAESDDPEAAAVEVRGLLDALGVDYEPQTRSKSDRLRADLESAS